MIDTRSSWLRFAQRFDPPHNPPFDGYRRTLHPMPRPSWRSAREAAYAAVCLLTLVMLCIVVAIDFFWRMK